jgi:ABC-2 type transport system permease protein
MALLWSRKEMMMANKMVMMNLLIPALMVVLYQYMFKSMEDAGKMIFFMVLPMIPAFLGYLLPTVVAEEAEKNNQRSLRLAGVKSWEYVLASLLLPFVVAVIYLVILPVYLRINLSELGWQYIPVMLLTSLIVFLIFMALALMTDTQTRASIVAMPVMMVSSFLPMFAMMDKTVEKIIDFTYLGAYSVYSKEMSHYQIMDKSFLFLIIWLMVALLGVIWLTRQRQIIK